MGGYDDALHRYVAADENCNPKKGGTYDNIPLEVLGTYNCGDVIATKKLREVIERMLIEEGLLTLYQEVVLPMVYTLADFLINGFRVDADFAATVGDQYTTRILRIVNEARELKDVQRFERDAAKAKKEAWEKFEAQRMIEGKKPRKKPKFAGSVIFNPGSDQQVGDVLFRIAGLEPLRYTDTDLPSVDRATREALLHKHPLVPLKDDHARLAKFYGTYIKRIEQGIKLDGLYHPSYDITGTVTGRLSGDMQQLPRGTTNEDIKRLFISRFGDQGILLNQDVKGAELRAFANVSKDEALVKIFKEGKDPHIACACLLYNMDYDEFSARYEAKDPKFVKIREDEIKPMVSFGLTYGREAPALAEDMGWPLAKAERFRKKYFTIFSGIKRSIEHYRDFAKVHGYVVNPMSRIRRVSAATLTGYSNRHTKERALRQAVNFVIQSSAHDLAMVAMIDIQSKFQEHQLDSKLLGEVHDSVLVDVYLPELKTVVSIMERAFEVLEKKYDWVVIPMDTDIKVGSNLLDMIDLKKYYKGLDKDHSGVLY
jgi:DNA polymerase I-like protein with 3'-5' exonuclease and polymerase domains